MRRGKRGGGGCTYSERALVLHNDPGVGAYWERALIRGNMVLGFPQQ